MLKQLLDEDAIRLIQGNATLSSARVVLIADDAHYDELLSQRMGAVGNALRGPHNIVLVEGAGRQSDPADCATYLPVGFEWHAGGSDDLAGWDDEYFYQKSMQNVQGAMLKPEVLADLIAFVENPSLALQMKERVDRALRDAAILTQGAEYAASEGLFQRNESLREALMAQSRNLGVSRQAIDY